MRRPRAAVLKMFVQEFEFPEIRDFSKPSVTLHKNGRFLLFKPNDMRAADVLRELNARMDAAAMKNGKYYGLTDIRIKDWPTALDGVKPKRVQLWRHLSGDVAKHPFCAALQSYGIEVGTSPTLKNYIRKEYRRRVLEATPYSAPPVQPNDVDLFNRCSPGTNLLCTADFTVPGEDVPLFKKGQRYMVVRDSGEGVDKIGISITPVEAGAEISLVGEGTIHDWSALDPPMEDFFDDSENVDFGPDMRECYPNEVRAMEQRIQKLAFVVRAQEAGTKFPLYEHVRLDAAEEALKRGVVNCKLMRMGKTSEAITICELWGSKKIAVIGTKNVRLAWRREFKRLGYKDEDIVMVNRLKDLEKSGRYYLMTYDWIKDQEDTTAKGRKENENYLHRAVVTVKRKVSWSSDTQEIKVLAANPCPHCGEPMVRPVLHRDPLGVHVRTEWITHNGYLCRNLKCKWQTNNAASAKTRDQIRAGRVVHGGTSHHGAAWAGKNVQHKPGSYVDYGLAAHQHCQPDPETRTTKGRICLRCGQVDGTWVPPRYRRIKDQFGAVVGDEIHNAKDFGAQASRAMYAFRARRRIAMTGTLLSNSPVDAYWPLHWAVGGPRTRLTGDFPYRHQDGKKAFEKRFCRFVILEKPTGEVDEETGEAITKPIKKRTPFLINPPDWWKAMQPKIKRRIYEDPLFAQSLLEAGMCQPAVDIKRVRCEMHPKQTALMLDALRDFKKQWEQIKETAETKNQEINPAMVIAKMTSLRKIATVPERLNAEFRAKTGLDTPVYDGPAGGGKMMHIVNLAQQGIKNGKKILILSDFVNMQQNCELALSAHQPIRLLTSWSDDKRDEAVTLFTTDPARKVFIAGTRAIKESLDLAAADVVICCDLLWSPAFQRQAWSRAMAPTPRERSCDVYLMLSQNSLDEHIFTVFYSKMIGAEQALDRKVMSRRAMDFDVKFFAERVLEEEAALSMQVLDVDTFDHVTMGELDLSLMEERL